MLVLGILVGVFGLYSLLTTALIVHMTKRIIMTEELLKEALERTEGKDE